MASIWDWVESYREEAHARGDRERVALTEIHPLAYQVREVDPDRALMLFEEGRRRAVALNEPMWVLFFDHWRATAHLHFKRDYSDVLELTVRAALEARKPLYDGHPLRHAAYDDLLASYLGIDPLGYAERIREALDYLDGEIPDEPDSARYLLLARQRLFAFEQDRLDDAIQHGRQEQALADQDPDRHRARHFLVFLHTSLCDVAHRRQAWDELEHHARTGEELARAVGHQLELSELLAWQAVLARREQSPDALRLFRTAMARFSRLKMPPGVGGFNALAAFHELGNELPQVLKVRRLELSTVAGKGRLAQEALCRVTICELLSRLGEPPDEEAWAARAAVARLRFPEALRARLDRAAPPPPARPEMP